MEGLYDGTSRAASLAAINGLAEAHDSAVTRGAALGLPPWSHSLSVFYQNDVVTVLPRLTNPTVEQGLTDLTPICRQSLERRTMQQLYDLNSAHAAGPHIPDDLWVHVIYDVATAYPHQILAREHPLKSLTPLYRGRTASFVLAAQRFTFAEVEHAIQHLCGTFEKHKPYLLERWD